jgi:hypothetical protein
LRIAAAGGGPGLPELGLVLPLRTGTRTLPLYSRLAVLHPRRLPEPAPPKEGVMSETWKPEWRQVPPGTVEAWSAGDSGRWLVGIGRKSGVKYLNVSVEEAERLVEALSGITGKKEGKAA